MALAGFEDERSPPLPPRCEPGNRVANAMIDSSSAAVKLPGDSKRQMTRVLCRAARTDREGGSCRVVLHDRGKSGAPFDELEDPAFPPPPPAPPPFPEEDRGAVMSGCGEGEGCKLEVVICSNVMCERSGCGGFRGPFVRGSGIWKAPEEGRWWWWYW